MYRSDMSKANGSRSRNDVAFSLIQGDPPPARRRGERWWQVAEACTEAPGVWAEVPDCAPGVAHAIRHGRYQAFRGGQWEVMERPAAVDGRMNIYVRFLSDV